MRARLTILAFSLILAVQCLTACSLVNPQKTVVQENPYPVLAPPVLHTAQELEYNGVRGLWMSESDVANLMIWIHNVNANSN